MTLTEHVYLLICYIVTDSKSITKHTNKIVIYIIIYSYKLAQLFCIPTYKRSAIIENDHSCFQKYELCLNNFIIYKKE